jgi:hypothetical protein
MDRFEGGGADASCRIWPDEFSLFTGDLASERGHEGDRRDATSASSHDRGVRVLHPMDAKLYEVGQDDASCVAKQQARLLQALQAVADFRLAQPEALGHLSLRLGFCPREIEGQDDVLGLKHTVYLDATCDYYQS